MDIACHNRFNKHGGLCEAKDEEILALSLNEPNIFELLISRYEEAFLRKAKSILINDEDAQDVVQETFVKIYIAGKRFKAVDGASFSSWAYKILIRQCFTLYTKKKKEKQRTTYLEEDILNNMPDLADIDEKENTLLREEMLLHISKLPSLLRNLITSYFFENKSHEEIAKEEGISEQASRTRLHRAKSKLRVYIENNL